MIRLVLDTNVYTALMAGDQRMADALARVDAVLLSTLVLGELLDGFKGGKREEENRQILGRFRQKPRTVLLPLTEDSAEWFALIQQQLKRKGCHIPANDVWIAASCMEHGAMLLSLDKHFDHIDGLLRYPLPRG